MRTSNKDVMAFAVAAVLALGACLPTQAQGEGNMAMTLLPVVKEGDQQFIITPKGYKVAVPGKGLARDAKNVAVYQDAQQNYWYINKHGEPTEVDPRVVQSAYAQIQAQQQSMNQGYNSGYNSQQPPVQQTNNYYQQQPSSSSGSSSGSAVLGAAAGFAGAAAGAALVGSTYPNYYAHPYGGVPYGTPIYRGASVNGAHNNGNSYYYNNNGNKTYVNASKETQNHFNQFDQQGAWKDKDQWSRPNTAAANPSANGAAGGRFANRNGEGAGRFGGADREGGRFGGGEGGGRFGGGARGGFGGRRR